MDSASNHAAQARSALSGKAAQSTVKGLALQFTLDELAQGENIVLDFALVGAFDHDAHARLGAAGANHQTALVLVLGLQLGNLLNDLLS